MDSRLIKNNVTCYNCQQQEGKRAEFEQELEIWIEDRILSPRTEDVATGVLPLMVAVQPTKNKIRSVLDYRELNQYVSCNSGGERIDECVETIRKWRWMIGAFTVVDLKSCRYMYQWNCGNTPWSSLREILIGWPALSLDEMLSPKSWQLYLRQC